MSKIIPIKKLIAKDPAYFISWSQGTVINRKTFEKYEINFIRVDGKNKAFIVK